MEKRENFSSQRSVMVIIHISKIYKAWYLTAIDWKNVRLALVFDFSLAFPTAQKMKFSLRTPSVNVTFTEEINGKLHFRAVSSQILNMFCIHSETRSDQNSSWEMCLIWLYFQLYFSLHCQYSVSIKHIILY